jgi:hypothetical protein
MRRLILAAVVMMSTVACAVVEPPVAAEHEGLLLPSLQVYTAGEEVMFVLLITNTSSDPVEVNFTSGQSFDFTVAAGQREVWRWSEEQMFTQALRSERLEPGESRRYEATWRPDASEIGEFVATGVLTASEHRVEQSTRIVLP